MFWVVASVLALAGLGLALGAPAAASDAYIEDIAAAAVHIEQGNYDRAARVINSALALRSGDPLAHVALGTVFLHTRQLDRALKEFTAANNVAKDHPVALYGLALYYLASGKSASAQNYLDRVAAAGTYDVGPTIAYLSALSGRYPEGAAPTADAALLQIWAQGRFKRGEYKEARRVLSGIVEGRCGFEEEFGAVMTFDPASAVALTGRALSKPYKPASEAEGGLGKVSGIFTLKADLRKTQGIAYVLFLVDDALIAMVNHFPYECEWDTRQYANAPHTVKIQGNGLNGVVLSERSVRVLVSNKVAPTSGVATGEDAERAQRKLWDCLRLKPSLRLAYYTLAKCAQAERDDAAALAALERVVAIDPKYKDARSLLARHYSPLQKYREIWRVLRKDKVAAITFDDGPSPRTGRLLDILAQKGVKATFFVVGSMAEANPSILRRIASEGHEIENHTYSHRNLRYLSGIEIERELMRTVVVVRSITGRSSRYFRPPGGHQNGSLASAAGKYGFSSVFWTVNCSKHQGTKPDNIVRQVASATVPGSIILMHHDEDVTLMALPRVIDALRAKGYRLVTLSELVTRDSRPPLANPYPNR